MDYDPSNIKDRNIHLTNNSVVKHCEAFDESEIEGNMWSCDEFKDHLSTTFGSDVFMDKIWP